MTHSIIIVLRLQQRVSVNRFKLLFIFLIYIYFFTLQVWKYGGTDKIVNGALEQIRIDVQILEGQTEMDVLLAGGVHGSLRYNGIVVWCTCACVLIL